MEQLTLDGGVDLSHSVPMTPAGKLRECYNYEVGWERGYARIDGFERFDGNISASTVTGWVARIPVADVTGTFFAPEKLMWVDTDGIEGDAQLVRTKQETTNGADYWVLELFFRAGRPRPEVGAEVTGNVSGASFTLTNSVEVKLYEDEYAEHGSYLSNLKQVSDTLRAEVLPVPGGGTIVGIHWHEDRLYAIRDVQSLTVSSTDYPKFKEGMYVYTNQNEFGQIIVKDDETNSLEIAPATAGGFKVEPGDTLSIALQFRFKEGNAPEIKPGDQVIIDGLSTYAVGVVNTRVGDWTTGSGSGDMALTGAGSQLPPVDALVYRVPGNFNDGLAECKVEQVYFVDNENTGTVVTTQSRSTIATLWRSSDSGWESANTNRIMRFTGGVLDPTTPDPTPVNEILTLGRAGKANDGPVEGWFATGQAQDPPTVAELTSAMKDDDSAFGAATIFGQLYAGGPLLGMPDLLLSEWQISNALPSTAEVLALSVGFDMSATDPDAFLLVSRNSRFSPTEGVEIPTTPTTVWVGEDGSGNPVEDWNKDWKASDINNGTFAIKIGGLYGFGVGSSTQVRIDQVRVKVRYNFLTGSKMFIWDGTNDLGFVQLSDVALEDGAWADGDASGFFTLEDWNILTIPAGSELRTAANGAGQLIAKTVSNVELLNLPGSLALREENAKYQFISYNFYATEERNAFYGCSGAGPAFSYEPSTNNLRFINTGVDNDRPRHVAAHQSRLALGYKWGEVYVSAPGDPFNFNGVDFASSFGFGDKVTGLMTTVGDALGVFTESSVWMLTGAEGDDSNPPRQQVVNARVGAIEYTVQSMGNRPIFSSFRGVETLETTEQYGEFFTTPNTYDISPWLLERLQTAAGVEATDKSVVNSVVVRNKNQYRLFFADGFVMTLTLVGVERDPQNTIQRYYFNGTPNEYLRCFATTSGVTTDGRDRAFVTCEDRPDAVITPEQEQSSIPEADYVYELDRGRSFDGGPIASYFTLSYNLGQQQQAGMTTKRYNVIHAHGKVPGYAGLRLSRAAMYEDLDTPPLNFEDMSLGSLSQPSENRPKAKYSKGRLSGRGFAISLRINHESDREFPHVLQHITFVDDDPKRVNR